MSIVKLNVQFLVSMSSIIAHNHSKMTESGFFSNIQSTQKFCLMKGENTWRPNMREKEPVERSDNDSHLHILHL